MADLLRLQFGATKSFGSDGEARSFNGVLDDVAAQNNLTIRDQGVSYHIDGNDWISATFYFERTGVLESQLQTYNNAWKTICAAQGWARLPAVVTFYQG